MKRRKLDDYLKGLDSVITSKDVDVEALIRRVIELSVEETLRRITGIQSNLDNSQLHSSLASIVERLRSIENNIAVLEEKIEKLTREYKRLAETIAAIKEFEARDRKPEWIKELEKVLNGRNYILLSENKHLLSLISKADRKILAKYGIEILELEKDIVVITWDGIKEFIERLREASRIVDEREAAKAMGIYSKLFEIFRNEGLLIYSSRHRAWQPQDLLKKVVERIKGLS